MCCSHFLWRDPQMGSLLNLAYRLTGCQSFFFEGRLGFRGKKNSLIWRLKEKGPRSVPLRTDKNLEKQHLGSTHTRREKKIKNNLVVKTRGGMEQWQSGSFGNFLSAFIRVMWSWLFCRDQSNLRADGIALLRRTGDSLCFFSEAVIGPLCHGPERANSHCHRRCAATTRVFLLCTAHNVLPELQAPFHIKVVLNVAVIKKLRLFQRGKYTFTGARTR